MNTAEASSDIPDRRMPMPDRHGRPSTGIAVTASVLAGFSALVAFPPYDMWWAAPVSVALLAVAVRGRRVSAGFALGGLTGLVLFVPLLSFTGLQVGWVPWLLLAALQATFLAVQAAISAATSMLADRRPMVWPLLTGTAWVGQEALRGRIPFGGFPWGRIAFSQADAPTARFAAVGGAPMVTFVVAAVGGLLAIALWQVWDRPQDGRPRSWRKPVAAGAAATLATLGGVIVPAVPAEGRNVVVAVIQGNVPRLGLDFNTQRRAVLDNHVNATLSLAEKVAAGRRPQPDLVVWPENASDLDPYQNPDAAQLITTAAQAVGVPILLGAVLRGPGAGQVRNAGLVWSPEGKTTATYVKRHPVPFAEYIPLRPWVRRITALVDRVRADFVPGVAAGVIPVGGVIVGDVICFEVAYDGLVRDTVTGGGQLLVVQTNNATFNPAQARQQLAMVRLRAIEHARPAVMASTVGISAVVTTDGSVRDASEFNTAAIIVQELRLGDDTTLATRLGAAVEMLLAVTALLAVGVAWHVRRGDRRRARQSRGVH